MVVDKDYSSRTNLSSEVEDLRDEVQEIKRESSKDTARVRMLRILVALGLAIMGAAVSFTAYALLVNQEEENFEDAFERFSQTVADAAQDENLRIREALETVRNNIESTAEAINTTWPFFHYPKVNAIFQDQRDAKNLEEIQFVMRVPHEVRYEYLDFQAQIMDDWVSDGQMRAFGNLDNFQPGGWMGDIFEFGAQGPAPVPNATEYFPFHYRYPPWNNYLPISFEVTAFEGPTMFQSAIDRPDQPVTGHAQDYFEADEADAKAHARFHSQIPGSKVNFPHSFTYLAVKESFEDFDSRVVAFVGASIPWDAALRNLLPTNVKGIDAVVSNTCDQVFSYRIVGQDAFFSGYGDKHDPKYSDLGLKVDLNFGDVPMPGSCQYFLKIYPSDEFKADYSSDTPVIYVSLVATTVGLMILVFFLYDWMVERRNHKLIMNAAKSNTVVTNMFPGALRDKVIQQNIVGVNQKAASATELKVLMEKGVLPRSDMDDTPALAELYTDTSILFADIAGFTAWSSVREPHQVFKLLESIFRAFDEIARARKVLKVETVGDCYVCVTGCPSPQKDHAVIMCRFASDCISTFKKIVKNLEVQLGPDTGDLNIRIGIHSGQLTAGVLRGERARFQLFGDTVNTAARLESGGKPGKIHVSLATAECLRLRGRNMWLEPREEKILAKGKGEMETYWVKINRKGESDNNTEDLSSSTASNLVHMDIDDLDGKIGRLIQWNTETLITLLKQIVARRSNSRNNRVSTSAIRRLEYMENNQSNQPLEEVQEIISLPEYDGDALSKQVDPISIKLDDKIASQVRAFVTAIASLYRRNAFHNFQHASHVTMSVTKLLSRIVRPREIEGKSNKQYALHDHTYGITSDPLTQFACAFSALIHDVDHMGVPNAQLIEEKHPITEFFHNRSVAEQFSLTLSWDLLMEDRFKDFRQCLYTNESELLRFRQLVVNGVMATDIADKELKNLRNARWAKAFEDEGEDTAVPAVNEGKAGIDRKATIVIEHIIQASDIAHTMQHWHVYRKWNECLFTEMYQAYLDGRSAKDPSTFWYKGEIGFFDFYIIPLAKKLKECGVFGVSSDEYLNYALKNREEWERCGQKVVAEMMETVPKRLQANPLASRTDE